MIKVSKKNKNKNATEKCEFGSKLTIKILK